MKKLTDLSNFLKTPETLTKAGLSILPGSVTLQALNGLPEWNGDGTATGILLFDNTYQCSITVDDAAFINSDGPTILLALVMTWVSENDPDRNHLPNCDINWKSEPLASGNTGVVLSIWFKEQAHFKEVGAGLGQFCYFGKEYLSEVDVSVDALSFELAPIAIVKG